jgi:hypothetical protein
MRSSVTKQPIYTDYPSRIPWKIFSFIPKSGNPLVRIARHAD